jgi:hypothetical protein
VSQQTPLIDGAFKDRYLQINGFRCDPSILAELPQISRPGREVHVMIDSRAIHLIINTHTPRHLRLTLLGAAVQSVRPDSVVLTCDVSDAAIAQCAADAAREFRFDLALIQRPHQGIGRPAQARNNAVRWLLNNRPCDPAVFILLDGDCFAPHSLVQTYRTMVRRDDLAIGGRIELNEEQTANLNEHDLQSPNGMPAPNRNQIRSLHRQARKTQFQSLLKRARLTKRHKPRLIGANFAIDAEIFRRINGFDEEFQGWGVEDDDLARRAYAAGARPVIAVREAVVLHQWHPTRAPGRWHDNPAAKRFQAGGPTRCVYGLDNPFPQDDPHVTLFTCGAETRQPETQPA